MMSAENPAKVPARRTPRKTKAKVASTAPTRSAAEHAAGRDYDIVVFGASGFVGRLVAAHLARVAAPAVRIALAGRDTARIERVRAELPPSAEHWPVLGVSADDDDALATLAASTRVIATTVGPYARLGLPLVRACASHGTHYVDLTGEVLFVRRSIDIATADAVRTGARIVHSCGFDSVPSDLAVLALHEAADEALLETTYVLEKARGGVSGGTIDSLRGQVDEMRDDRESARLAADPYSLSPDRGAEPDLGRQPDLAPVYDDPGLGGWVGPFVMASYNTRIVRRSNALLGHAYGRRMRYREVMAFGTGPAGAVRAAAVAVGLRATVAGLALGPTRTLLDKVLPGPGEGPDEKTRAAGFFRAVVHTRTESGRRLRCTFAAEGDPGYAATAVMMGESALTLLEDERLPDRAGVLTPATGLGRELGARLRSRGFTIDTASQPGDDRSTG